MPAPWTAAQAKSDDVSKKMLITHMQENARADFLSEHKLTGQVPAIVKRVTKDQLVEMYTSYLGKSGGGGAAGGSAFTFDPKAGGASAANDKAFSFNAAAAPADAGKASPFTFNAAVPPPAAPAGNFSFNFAAPPPGGGGGDDGDDDLEEVDTGAMSKDTRKKGGGMIPAELQQRMERLNMSADDRRKATLAELPADVRTRVEGLEKGQEDVDKISKEFEEKLAKLKEEYDKKKAPLYKARYDVVNGKDGGVPDFWLKVLQNNMITSEEVQKHDEEALKALTDIKMSTQLGGGKKGFQLAFMFGPNDYFEDKMMTKTYLFDPDDEDECLTKAIGHEIKWKPGKNVTVRTVEKKQKKKGKVRTLKVEEPCDSFFQFFDPPSVPEEEDEMEEDEVKPHESPPTPAMRRPRENESTSVLAGRVQPAVCFSPAPHAARTPLAAARTPLARRSLAARSPRPLPPLPLRGPPTRAHEPSARDLSRIVEVCNCATRPCSQHRLPWRVRTPQSVVHSWHSRHGGVSYGSLPHWPHTAEHTTESSRPLGRLSRPHV